MATSTLAEAVCFFSVKICFSFSLHTIFRKYRGWDEREFSSTCFIQALDVLVPFLIIPFKYLSSSSVKQAELFHQHPRARLES